MIRWELRHGEAWRLALKTAEETKNPAAKMHLQAMEAKGQAPPLLPEELEYLYEAFWRLSSCRQVGFGEGPIPWRDIAHYGMLYGMSDDQFAEFADIISALDGAYLNERRSEQTKPEEGSK